MEVEILLSGNGKHVTTLTDISDSSTVYDIKKEIFKKNKKLPPTRQALRLETRGGKFLADDLSIDAIEFKGAKKLYVKDLGPQIGWKTVFLLEYAGPLALYIWSYSRPAILYGAEVTQQKHSVVHLAAICWIIHYSKRLLETLFVHRFSHATMPIQNLFKNCSYYWMFGLYIGYYVNHPLYTPPTFGDSQVYIALAAFMISELGNFSIHIALKNLRPPGTHERKIPYPTWNPLTSLFKFVSCPNYTYEVYSWMSFTAMTQCLPAGLFAIAGLYQMTVWAIGKHRNYKKEFPNYPKNRKAIIPFLI